MRILAVALATLALAACAPSGGAPDRVAEAVGTATTVENGAGVTRLGFAHDAEYEYFEGTTFVLDEEVTVGGAVSDASAIETGDRIEVWTQECAESFPVQCRVEHVEVLD